MYKKDRDQNFTFQLAKALLADGMTRFVLIAPVSHAREIPQAAETTGSILTELLFSLHLYGDYCFCERLSIKQREIY